MTKRTPISAPQNVWFDAQQVDDSDLTLEQNYNSTITSGIINNHIGSGVLPEVLVQNILFDSSKAVGFLDGVAVYAQNQPADNNFGNQLEIELTESEATIQRNVKVAVIGLDFQDNLQYETFVFKTNESQVSKKHFKNILVLLFNDFIGNPNLSMNLGGKIIIKEANPMSLSRDPIMLAQDIQPNLFFRDFFVDGVLSLQTLLQAALPFYNIDTLNIYTNPLDNQALLKDDVTTQIGQKFLATTNNIQKVTLLLSVRNLDVGNENDLAWTGDLVLSIYPLQSTLDCPTDLAPNLPIEFSPSNTPIAQVSFNYSTLAATGITLDSVPQPVDFVLSNTPIAAGNVLTPDKYYAVTLKRSGTANKCDILMAVGGDLVPDSRLTVFSGTIWVDITEQDLWFRLWTDAAKLSDGQGYDTGHGMTIPKTILDETTQATIDYSLDNIYFTGNDVYRAIVAAATQLSVPVPDQRTGNPVLSRKQFVPDVNLLNSIELANLADASDPLIIGAISDKNKKSFDPAKASILSKLYSATFVDNELLIKVVTDPTDTARYDLSVIGLVSDLLNGNFVGAKIYPNANNTSVYYRVGEARLCTMICGDVNGDGLITQEDVDLLNTYLNYNLNVGLPLDTTVVTDGYNTTYTNGYTTYTQPFSNLYGIDFQLVDPLTNAVIAYGVDGVLVADPNDPRLAYFTSASVSFNSIVGVGSYKLVLRTLANLENYGGFDILGVNATSDVVTIRKVYLTGDVIGSMLRADVDGDFVITTNDGYLLQSYVDRLPVSTSYTFTYPAPSTFSYDNIGKTFNVIKIKLEKFMDRDDDYSPVVTGRSTTIHPLPDMFINDGYYPSHNFVNFPSNIDIQTQLTWDESLIVTNTRAKLVPSVFSTMAGFQSPSCNLDGVLCNIYPSKPEFDSGRVDYFVPDNLIIGPGGELQRPDGNFYKVDFEVGTIVLEIPNGLFGSERTINIMEDFIASTENDTTLTGVTKLGFPAMRFADCTLVTPDALSKDQIRFSVAVQSFSPNTNGLSEDGYSGAIVDGKIGVAIDYQTGLLTLNFTNLYQDDLLSTLSTKIQVNVFLKKGGFNNKTLFVDSTKVQNMLKLISVFSGPVVGGPSALVDLESDVSGILPIVHGGTGLNAVGAYGTVLTSNGSGLNYQFIYNLPGVIPFSSGISSANKIPKTDGYGLLDPSFYYKNPVYMYGFAGSVSTSSTTGVIIGAVPFRFDNYILQGLSSIKLEVILETDVNNVQIQLYDLTGSNYINLVGANPILSTGSTTTVFLASDDIKASLNAGAVDHIYQIELSVDNVAATGICRMARLVMTYDNPYDAQPPIAHSWNFVPYLPSPTPI